MTDDLFANLPPMKSPRLLWMEKHGITVDRKATSIGPFYTATAPNLARTGTITAKAGTEHDALVEMALQLNIKLWNQ